MKLFYPVEDLAGYSEGTPLAIAWRTEKLESDPFALRSYQQEAVASFHQQGSVRGGSGVLVLPCGAGKTVIGMGVMAELQCETLILTTSTTGDFSHFHVFNEKNWGLIIYDEVHLLPAPVFRATADLQAKRRLGLTATLVREDGKEEEVFSLIGPKKVDVPWRLLEAQGWIATAECTEWRIPMSQSRRMDYALAEEREKFRLAAENPRKLERVLELLEQHRDDLVLVIGQYVRQLEMMACELNAPLITGKTPQRERDRLYEEFRSGRLRRLVVSKVANFAIDLPDANVAIQISGTFGSRQEEAQRLGRILRPKQGDGEMKEPTTPKFRPVFGTKAIEIVNPETNTTHQTSANKDLQNTGSAQKKLKLVSWPDYFAKLESTERILLGYIVYRQPEDLGMNDFYNYNAERISLLDKDLPDLDYAEVERLLTHWKKVGLLEAGRLYHSYRLKEGVSEAYWQWLSKQAPPESFDFEPEKIYPSHLSGTLDNLLNLLVMIDHGEVLVTRTREINKHSMKRIRASLTEPVGPEIFNPDTYLYWLLSVVQMLKLIGSKGDHLVLSSTGKALSKKIHVEDLLCTIYPSHIRSIPLKGFFLILPILDRCTEWTSWAQMVRSIIPVDNVGNLVRRDRVISILDPLRFVGLLDWGEYHNDILVRTTPLGQLLFPKLLRGHKLAEYSREIKLLTDLAYPMDGPDTAYVQPNFEILVPHSASWAVRWELGQFAVLGQQDQMLNYRLDKTYLLNALKRGLQAGDVLNLLTKLSPNPLPENLVITIQQWIESFGQATFIKLSLLECITPEQAASIASARKYKDYVLGLYNPTAVIVREPEKLRKLLEKQGIYPLPGILDGEGVAERKGK
ncbi:MAG TPA: helicase-related protein [Desulfosporosinus sp.]|nr:helicase-related protein [Desulfosporosinus sp.]